MKIEAYKSRDKYGKQFHDLRKYSLQEWESFIAQYLECPTLLHLKVATGLKMTEIRRMVKCLRRSGLLLPWRDNGLDRKPVNWEEFCDIYTACETMNEACKYLGMRRPKIEVRLQFLKDQGIPVYILPWIETEKRRERQFHKLVHPSHPQDYERKLAGGRYEEFKKYHRMDTATMMHHKRRWEFHIAKRQAKEKRTVTANLQLAQKFIK